MRRSLMTPTKKLPPSEKPQHFDLLWKEYFRDPSQWRDNRSSKIGPGYPDFKHKVTSECLWIDGQYNPPWVHEELRRRGLSDDGNHPKDDECNDFVALLRSCTKNKDLSRGSRAHDEILKRGLLYKCSDALITMYAKCGELPKAKELLETHESTDVFSWTAIIAGYTEHGQSQDALSCLEQMQKKGLSPDWVTFTCALKACGSIRAVDKGEQIHDEIAKQGLLGRNIVLDSALVDMYAKCGALVKAREMLDKLPGRNVVTWSALISGYVQEGQWEEAMKCFEQMQWEGVSPNGITYAYILKVCGSLGAAGKGKQIHDEIRRRGFLKKDIVLGTALVDMYAKCGNLTKAREVFRNLSHRDVASWNALIVGHTQQGQAEEALNCFERMQHAGLSPNAITFSCMLKACGRIGAVDKGEEIHNKIAGQGLLKNNLVLGNALIDFYAKCGALGKAQQVLEGLPSRDVGSWNALLTGYAQQGQCDQTLNCFKQMQDDGFSPNAVTFSCVLNACSHLGLIEEAQVHFSTMSIKYGVKPDVEHYTCMIDLFGRAGQLNKAVEIIQLMPSSNDFVVWLALLGACRKWGDVNVGRWAFQNAMKVDESDPAAYVLMANIYAAAGMQEDAEFVEAMRKHEEVWKIPGCSWWLDMSGNVHTFLVGDTKHAQNKDILAKLEDITDKLSQEGYSPSLHWVSSNISDDSKRDLLCGHCEKLALACALLNTPQGKSIHIVKNLRLCGDCHSATALISKIEKRRIVVRDASCSHDFENGKCSCGNYSDGNTMQTESVLVKATSDGNTMI